MPHRQKTFSLYYRLQRRRFFRLKQHCRQYFPKQKFNLPFFNKTFRIILGACFIGTFIAAFITPSSDDLIKYIPVVQQDATEQESVDEPDRLSDDLGEKDDADIEEEEEPQPDNQQSGKTDGLLLTGPDASAEENDNAIEKPEDSLLEDELIPFFDSLLNEGEVTTLEVTLQKGENLSSLLKRGGDLSLADSLEVAKALNLVVPTRTFRAGQKFLLFLLKEKGFQGLLMETKDGTLVSVRRNPTDNSFAAYTKEGKLEIKQIRLEGKIKGSLSSSLQKIGAPADLAGAVTKAFDGALNMRTDLQTDAPFSLVYEQKKTQTGRQIGENKLLFVSLKTKIGTKQLYYFTDSKGQSAYFNEEGKSGQQDLMTRPLGKGRISSPFGMRKHPILGYQIKHSGVDFPKPKGTPVPAGGDGVIVRMGRRGAYGKHIQIKHNRTYSTLYAHLNAYNTKMKVGSKVKKGDIIAYVGSTGRSTGPHLHYEVIKNGVRVQPLNRHTLFGKQLKGKDLKNFIVSAKKLNPNFSYKKALSATISEQKDESNKKSTTVQKKNTKAAKKKAVSKTKQPAAKADKNKTAPQKSPLPPKPVKKPNNLVSKK
jgi:murein DD-endopeptidase MepM/ murein hydrolase activator NlpD